MLDVILNTYEKTIKSLFAYYICLYNFPNNAVKIEGTIFDKLQLLSIILIQTKDSE